MRNVARRVRARLRNKIPVRAINIYVLSESYFTSERVGCNARTERERGKKNSEENRDYKKKRWSNIGQEDTQNGVVGSEPS